MKKFLVFPDGGKFRLVDISYEEFLLMDVWQGSSDTAYSRYMQKRGMHALDEFSDLADAKVIIEWKGIDVVPMDIFENL
jgi:hypothetical protein